jgi:hypothetical protein
MILIIEGLLLPLLTKLMALVSQQKLLLIALLVILLVPVSLVLGLLVLIVNNLILLNLVLVLILYLAPRGTCSKIRLSRMTLSPRTDTLGAPLRAVLIQMLLTVIVVFRRFLEAPLSSLEIVQWRVSVLVKPVILHRRALLNNSLLTLLIIQH